MQQFSYRLLNFCDRLGWECHLCGKAIPREIHPQAPMAPSKDHLIPRKRIKKRIKKGSISEKELAGNFRPAHRWCNSHRQHFMPENLPSGYFDGLEEAQADFVREHGVLV